MSDYSDIIDHPHYRSKKRPHMSMIARAAQFSPYAALVGYGEAVEETGRLTDEKAVLDFRKEQQVTDKERELMKKLIKEGKDFIMDDTNLKRKYRKQTVQWLRTLGVKSIAVYFDTPLETCIKRREGQIDAETMKKIASGLTMPEKDEYDELIKVK